MTEQEAIKYIESHGYISDDVKDMAINALEEIQKYRAIGTPEECRAAVEKQEKIVGKGDQRRMKKYVLNCPNALKNPKNGSVISTQFVYDTLSEALEHKALCDLWDREHGREPTTYIEEEVQYGWA